MIPLTLGEVAAATGGRLRDGAEPAQPVTAAPVIDSRLAGPGSLFVALPGSRVDGHDFTGPALAAGAVAVLAGRPVGQPAVVVDDPARALGRLARAVLDRLPWVRVVGVTGSSGKTSTKDLIAWICAADRPTVAPVGSYNNELGLPLTVLRADTDTRLLVLEYGARRAGHIRYLTGLATPDVAVVLNVGRAHVGEFGDLAGVAAAKSELPAAVPVDGTVVLNADDPRVWRMRAVCRAEVVGFGHGPDATVRAEEVRLDQRGRPRFLLHTPEAAVPVRLGHLVGEHQVQNALAAVAAALALRVPLDTVVDRLVVATPASRWRMEVHDRPDGVTVVNDAYNANPESMQAALRALVALARPEQQPPRRCWAVLGEMCELGRQADELHHELGRAAARLGVDRVVAVGDAAALVAAGATGEPGWPGQVVRVADAAAAVRLLTEQLVGGDVVLVKASRAAGLERVATALTGAAAGVAG